MKRLRVSLLNAMARYGSAIDELRPLLETIEDPARKLQESVILSRLLERCVLKIGALQDPGPEALARLSPAARGAIERRMEEVAPQVTLTMDVHCPECGRAFEMPFDLQDFFFGELRTSRDLLYREVHYLAYHYMLWFQGHLGDIGRRIDREPRAEGSAFGRRE